MTFCGQRKLIFLCAWDFTTPVVKTLLSTEHNIWRCWQRLIVTKLLAYKYIWSEHDLRLTKLQSSSIIFTFFYVHVQLGGPSAADRFLPDCKAARARKHYPTNYLGIDLSHIRKYLTLRQLGPLLILGVWFDRQCQLLAYISYVAKLYLGKE